MIYNGGEIFLLDLSHVRIDFELNDLANLVVHCYLLNIDKKIIYQLIDAFFKINKIEKEKLKVLNIFITFHLIKNYINLIKKENKVSPYSLNHRFLEIFTSEIQKEKNKIIKLIQKFAEQTLINVQP
jgi:hypothetical protein